MISVIVCIFNKESIIEKIIKALFINSSEFVKEYIFVLDGLYRRFTKYCYECS